MERQESAADIWPNIATSPALQMVQKGCDNWNRWWGDCKNWWHPEDKEGTYISHLYLNRVNQNIPCYQSLYPNCLVDMCGTGDLEFSPDSGI